MEIAGYIITLIITSIISAALAPKPPSPKPAKMSDVDIPTAEQGAPIGMLLGSALIKGSNCVGNGDFSTKPIKTKGGKK